jgi:predicted phage baseplate assembly protein
VVLLDLFCGVGDMLAYYLDAQAAEAFLPTSRQRQNVINLYKLVSYRRDGPVAASTSLRFSLAAPLDADLVIPEGTACRARLDDGDVEFETAADAIIPSGRLSVDVGARQGRRKSETFTSTGEPRQTIQLAGTAVAQGTISVRIQDQEWTEVLHFQESEAESLHFQTDTDARDKTRIVFGDGLRGTVPEAGVEIEVAYLETLGASGNIGPNLVTELLTPVYLDGQQVALSVVNPTPSTGGADRETLEHARKQAPAEVRSLWKAVTKEDYKALAEGFPGVAKAQILDTGDCGNIRYYQVNMAVAPDGGGPPSALLKQDLSQYLESRKVITVEINLFEPVYRPVTIDAEIFAYAGEDLDLVRSRVEQALEDFFAFDRMDFGAAVHFSDLVALIDGVRGVSYVRMYAPGQDVEIRAGEIAVLGQVNLDVRRAE